MLRLVIAEDDINFRRELMNYFIEIDDVTIEYSTGNGQDAWEAINKIKPDIAVLDIDMPGMNGLKLASNIREKYDNIEIIFITSYEDFVREAIELYAADYIEKPLNKERIKKTIDRIKNRNIDIGNMIPFKSGIDIKIIHPKDIYSVEACDKKTIVCTTSEKFISEYSLKQLEEILDKNLFFRSSRSFLINLSKVDSLKEYSRTSFEVAFKNKDYKAYLSKDLYSEFRKKIKDIYK